MTTAATERTATLQEQGFLPVEDVLDAATVEQVLAGLEARPGGARGRNLRNVFDEVPAAQEVLRHPRVVELLDAVLGPRWFAVRAIVFDKTPDANWFVGWHQDQCITVKERVDVPGFGPWSVKQGVVHVEPPVAVLERMVTLRLHLDDCGEDNGPLKVVPGSHLGGWLNPEQIAERRQRDGVVTCTTRRGGAILMRPLLLHASSQATSPNHRRVLHIECAADDLPPPLEWHERRR